MIYVTSDIHGHKNELDKLLDYIMFSNNDELIIIGDIIDRGPESAELVDWVINTPSAKLILGNHEQMFMNAYESVNLLKLSEYKNISEFSRMEKSLYFDLWLSNGGVDTCISFNKFNKNNPKRNLYKEFYDYLKRSNKYMILDKYILVHAGTGFLRYENFNVSELTYRLDNLDSETLLWNRRFYDRTFNKGFCQSLTDFTTIIGHTPVYNNKKYSGAITKEVIIKYYPKNNSTVIALDLGVSISESLGILCLDNLKFYYIEKGEIKSIDLM